MATSPLTDAAVPKLDYPDLIRRAWAGEHVLIHDGIHLDLVFTAAPTQVSSDAEPFQSAQYDPDPVVIEQKRQELRRKTLDLGPEMTELLARLEAETLDPSAEATMARARRLEAERGEPLRMRPELADALEQFIAMRRPMRVEPWE